MTIVKPVCSPVILPLAGCSLTFLAFSAVPGSSPLFPDVLCYSPPVALHSPPRIPGRFRCGSHRLRFSGASERLQEKNAGSLRRLQELKRVSEKAVPKAAGAETAGAKRAAPDSGKDETAGPEIRFSGAGEAAGSPFRCPALPYL